jgi:hypothetical protein
MRSVICILVAVVLCGSAWAKPQARPEKVEVHVTHVATPRNLDCSSAIPVRIGDFVTGDNTGAPSDVDLYSCTSWVESGGEVVFELTLDEPGARTVGISLVYDLDICDLDLFVLGSCDENDCMDYDTYSWFFDFPGPGTYYVVVDGYHGDECPFSLAIVDDTPPDDCCPLLSVCQEFDFNASDGGFSTLNCGGASVWEWGPSTLDPAVDCQDEGVTNVLGTVLNDVTPNYAGEAAVIGPVSITTECSCMELCHYYDIEKPYDGGSVKVSADGGSNWDLLVPASFYDDQDMFLSLDTACLMGELAYSYAYHPLQFRTDCFDLSSYAGEDVLVGFFFGSDASDAEPGWYISSVRFGRSGTPVEHHSWGAIKALYR